MQQASASQPAACDPGQHPIAATTPDLNWPIAFEEVCVWTRLKLSQLPPVQTHLSTEQRLQDTQRRQEQQVREEARRQQQKQQQRQHQPHKRQRDQQSAEARKYFRVQEQRVPASNRKAAEQRPAAAANDDRQAAKKPVRRVLPTVAPFHPALYRADPIPRVVKTYTFQHYLGGSKKVPAPPVAAEVAHLVPGRVVTHTPTFRRRDPGRPAAAPLHTPPQELPAQH